MGSLKLPEGEVIKVTKGFIHIGSIHFQLNQILDKLL